MTMEWYGGELIARENAAARSALKDMAGQVLAKSIEVTPEQWGALRGSATIEEQNGGKTQLIFYGGPGAPYALRQHEAPEGWTYTTAGTGPKFLETPLRENADKVLKYINAAIACSLGG